MEILCARAKGRVEGGPDVLHGGFERGACFGDLSHSFRGVRRKGRRREGGASCACVGGG